MNVHSVVMGPTSAHTFPTHADLTYLTGHSVRGLMMCAHLIPAVQPEQAFAAPIAKVCSAERSGHRNAKRAAGRGAT